MFHVSVKRTVQSVSVILEKKLLYISYPVSFLSQIVRIVPTVYIVTYRYIARQRLGKHIPAIANMLNDMMPIARQRISKQAALPPGKESRVPFG
jgi:hypothetical protein